MEVSWIKLKTKMFDDEKIQLIEAMPEADAILVIWIKLLILAGKTNSNGFIFLANDLPYSAEMIATIFRRPLQIVKFALKTLKDFDMIEITESHVICINNWEKHQNIDGLEKVREQNRIRKQNERERKQHLLSENTDLSRDTSRDVTQQIKNKNKNKEKEIIIVGDREIVIKDYFINLLPIDVNQEFIEVWCEWVDYRKEIKKKITASTAKKQIEFLLKQPSPKECISISIKNAWQGLFEVKDGENTSRKRRKDFVTKDEYKSELESLYKGGK